MKLWPITANISLEFDSAQEDWWLPVFHPWALGAAGISVLFGLRVGVLGLHLWASIEIYDDELELAAVEDDPRAPAASADLDE